MAGGSGKGPTPNIQRAANLTKNASMLLVFWQGERLNRFEAEAHFDHCLNSTISTLENFGLAFDRIAEQVACVRGRKRTRCNRYWLNRSPDNLALAHALLTQWGALDYMRSLRI